MSADDGGNPVDIALGLLAAAVESERVLFEDLLARHASAAVRFTVHVKGGIAWEVHVNPPTRIVRLPRSALRR